MLLMNFDNFFFFKDFNHENNDFSYILINPSYDLQLKHNDIV